ncbi:hypothetical protein SAMN02910369_02618 [Lachnospiraceae bacterium NE2001]|nr:hypothetical protein SAMN02910369_02618 [Lachnospiraceae bacterium NE2001]
MERTNNTKKTTIIAGAIYGFCMGIFMEYMVLFNLHLPMRGILVACSVCSIVWAACGAVWGKAYYEKRIENKSKDIA